jgi:ElaB/YqjD/DUF883 family membrane-anchored ribosome-binding protein
MTKQERELKALREQVAQITERIQELVGEGGEKAEELLEEGWKPLRENLQSARRAWEEKVHQGQEKMKEADRFAHERPWQLIAGAVGVGLLLGMLFKRND